jgi:hypothetical protein
LRGHVSVAPRQALAAHLTRMYVYCVRLRWVVTVSFTHPHPLRVASRDAISSYFMDRLLLRFVSSLYEQIHAVRERRVLRHFGGHNYYPPRVAPSRLNPLALGPHRIKDGNRLDNELQVRTSTLLESTRMCARTCGAVYSIAQKIIRCGEKLAGWSDDTRVPSDRTLSEPFSSHTSNVQRHASWYTHGVCSRPRLCF